MPDSLAGALAGVMDPTAELQLQLQQAQGLSQDASKIGAEGGLLGALASTIAAARGGGAARDAVQQLTAAHQAAMPDLAAAYAAPDPYQWAAQNPDANPYARWTILHQTPVEVATAKEKMAQAALQQAQTVLPAQQGAIRQGLFGPGGGLSGYVTAPPASAPARLPSARLLPAPAPGQPESEESATGPMAGYTTGRPASLSAIPAPGPARDLWLSRLPPAQLRRLRAGLPSVPGAAGVMPSAQGPR